MTAKKKNVVETERGDIEIDTPLQTGDSTHVVIDSEVIALKPKEKLITVHAVAWFSDGNLKDFMEQYGYPCEWLANESRSLPMWLIKRCVSSGGEFEADV